MSGFIGGGGGSATGAVGPTGSIGATGSTGSIGTTGPTGPIGPGVSGINISNNNTALGYFQNVNLQGGLVGTTGPNNTVAINSLNDFILVGVAGANMASASNASGGMIQWNNAIYKQGAIGATTVGTAAGWITIQKSGYFEVNYNLTFTGVPSGTLLEVTNFLGATGGAGQYGYGSGTPISQSLTYINAPGASGSAAFSTDNYYVVYIPSGSSIETYYRKVGSAIPSGIGISPTGTSFTMKCVG